MSAPVTPPRRELGFLDVVAIVLGGWIGLIGLSVSFQTLADLARKHHLHGNPYMYPLGIDLGILALILIDWMYANRGRNAWPLRLAAWGLTGFTVWANAQAAKEGDDFAVGMHAVMPLLWVAMVEAGRKLFLGDQKAAAGKLVDSVPLIRWFLAPFRTLRLWRRMRLWGITSYPLALAYEDARLHGIGLLRQAYGRKWGRVVPRLVAEKLRTGRLADSVVAVINEKVAAGQSSGWEGDVAAWLIEELGSENPLPALPAKGVVRVSREPLPEAVETPFQKALPQGSGTPSETPSGAPSETPLGTPSETPSEAPLGTPSRDPLPGAIERVSQKTLPAGGRRGSQKALPAGGKKGADQKLSDEQYAPIVATIAQAYETEKQQALSISHLMKVLKDEGRGVGHGRAKALIEKHYGRPIEELGEITLTTLS